MKPVHMPVHLNVEEIPPIPPPHIQFIHAKILPSSQAIIIISNNTFINPFTPTAPFEASEPCTGSTEHERSGTNTEDRSQFQSVRTKQNRNIYIS